MLLKSTSMASVQVVLKKHVRTQSFVSRKKESTDINALAEESLKSVYFGLRAKDDDFKFNYKLELDPNMPAINVVSQEIAQVLLNIIKNAFSNL